MSVLGSRLLVATAQSGDVDSSDAVDEVVRLCRAQLGCTAKAALLFAASSYDLERVVERFREHLPDVPMVGCTSNALFSSSDEFERDSVGLCLFAGDELLCQAGAAVAPTQHPERVVELGRAHAAIGQPALTFLLLDALVPSAVALVGQLMEGLGVETANVVGCVAADQHQFEGTHMFFGDQVLPGAAVALSLYGPIDVAIERAHGWTPVGGPLEVTRATAETVYELDGRRALDVIRGRLGTDRVEELLCYPFAVNVVGDGYDYLRSIRAVDTVQGSLVCSGPVPEGAMVSLSDAQRSSVLAASESASLTLRQHLSEPDGMLVFSSAVREVVLGTRAAEEGARIGDLSPATPMLGVYGYGEIATGYQNNSLHNNSCIAVALRGRGAA